MAFLDNSGDIVLDAVLTDYGRKLLASGKASITRFAFFDDEIDYGLYDFTATSGSAYYDLEIMQTPILEAFTNNGSIAKYPLYASGLSTELFYLPTMKLKDGGDTFYLYDSTLTSKGLSYDGSVSLVTGSAILLATTTTDTSSLANTLLGNKCLLSNGLSKENTLALRVDVGIDNTAATRTSITSDLNTVAIYVKYDSRLLSLYRIDTDNLITSDIQIDDDSMATAIIDSATYSDIIAVNTGGTSGGYVISTDTALNTTAGFDCSIYIRPQVVDSLKSSDYYFSLLGSTNATVNGIAGVKTIDTSIQVISQNTGQSINIPIKICKQ